VSAIDLPHARRLAFGVVLGQAGVTVIVALGAYALAGQLAAFSALLGGGIATLGSLAMASVAFGSYASGGARRALAAFYLGEAAKVAVVVVLFVVALNVLKVVPLAMLAGFAATYLMYWIALAGALPGPAQRSGAHR
jgi:ATP synthase protein I